VLPVRGRAGARWPVLYLHAVLETRDPAGGGLRRFAVTFALLLAALLLWGVSTPMFGAADEDKHMIMAYAVVHGEWPGQSAGSRGPYFEVPAVYYNTNPCFARKVRVSAACQELHLHGPMQRLQTAASSYPPFYFAAVGWPTLFTSGLRSLAALMALAFDTLGRVAHRGPLVLARALAITPLVFFFGAVVNPSGLTIASALAMWTGGLLLVRGGPPTRSSVARFAGPLCLFLLMRRDSLYWAALIIGALALLASWDQVRRLARSPEMWIGAAAVAICAALSLLSGGSGDSGLITSGSSGSFWKAVVMTPDYLRQLIGVLGWTDTVLPFPVYLLFGAMVAFLLLAVWCFGSGRIALVTAAIAAAVIAVPVAIGTTLYPYFQGRYQMGFAVGLPMVAALGITELLDTHGWTWPRRAMVLMLAMIGTAQAMSFAQTLRRFTVGPSGRWWIFARPQWQPPHGSPSLLVVLFIAVIAALYCWLYRISRRAQVTTDTT
jgi:Predicted membrane protein (DUF2142)